MITPLSRQEQSPLLRIPHDNMSVIMQFLPPSDLIQFQHSCLLLSDLERARSITEEEQNQYYGCATAAHHFNMRFPVRLGPEHTLPFALPHPKNPTRVSEETQLALKSTISSLVEFLQSVRLLPPDLATKEAIESYYQAVLSPQFVKKLQVFLATGDPVGILECIPDYVEVAPKVFRHGVDKQQLLSQLVSLNRIARVFKEDEFVRDWYNFLSGGLAPERLMNCLKKCVTKNQEESVILFLRIVQRMCQDPTCSQKIRKAFAHLSICQDQAAFLAQLNELEMPVKEYDFLAKRAFPPLYKLAMDVEHLVLLISKGLFNPEAVCRETVYRFLPPEVINYLLQDCEKSLISSSAMLLYYCLPSIIRKTISRQRVVKIVSDYLPVAFQNKIVKQCESRLLQYRKNSGDFFVRDITSVLLGKTPSSSALKASFAFLVPGMFEGLSWYDDKQKAAKVRLELIKNLNEFFVSLLCVFPDNRESVERVARDCLLNAIRDIHKNKCEIADQAAQIRRLIRLCSPVLSNMEFINSTFESQSYDQATEMVVHRIRERPLRGGEVFGLFFDNSSNLSGLAQLTLEEKKQFARLILEREPDHFLSYLYNTNIFRRHCPPYCFVREIIDDLLKTRGTEFRFNRMLRQNCAIM